MSRVVIRAECPGHYCWSKKCRTHEDTRVRYAPILDAAPTAGEPLTNNYGFVPQVRLLCDCEHESDTLEVARAIKLYMVSKTSCEVSCARCLVVGNEIGIDVRKLRIEADNRTQPDFKWLQYMYVCPDVR